MTRSTTERRQTQGTGLELQYRLSTDATRGGAAAGRPIHAERQNAPRVARLMALAIRCEDLVRTGVVTDYAALARLGRISRGRMTQIMNLRLLSPDIQEAILFLPRPARICEKHMRDLCAIADWNEQRERWHVLRDNVAPEAAHLRIMPK